MKKQPEKFKDVTTYRIVPKPLPHASVRSLKIKEFIYYKGHMDKIKGEGGGGGGRWVPLGVEGWGENADNYNWITIKIY